MIQQSAPETLGPPEEVSLRAYWSVLVRQRRLIGAVIAIIVLVMGPLTFRQRSIYRSTTSLMPLSPARSSLSAALGEFNGLLPGLPANLAKDNPTDRLMAILQSRTLVREVIQHLGLLPLLFETRWDAQRQQWHTHDQPTLQDAVKALDTLATITASKKGVITIVIEHHDPVLAAAIANRYVSTLQQFLTDNAFSLAKKNRIFISEQLEKTRYDLSQAEEELKQFEQTYGIVALDAQTTAAIKAIALLEEQIMAKEVQLGVQQRLTTSASYEVTLLQEELRGLRGQLGRLQRGQVAAQKTSPTPPAEGQLPFSLQEAPDIKVRYARLQRENLVQNKLYTLLAQQLEQAKIDEARDEITFQILDQAVPADRKSKPQRALNIALAGVVGLFAGVFLAFMRDAFDTTMRSKEQVERFTGLPVLATMPAPIVRMPFPSTLAFSSSNGHNTRLPEAPLADALRYLHTRLQQLERAHPIQTVLLTGTEAAETIVTLGINLACVAAHGGTRVLLLDAHLRQPTLHQALHRPLSPGLAEALHNPEHWQQSIQHTQIPNLHLVAAGTMQPTTLANLASPECDALLRHYKEAYDLILCVVPTAPGRTEAAVFGSKTDTTCLVLLSGVSRREHILETKDALEAVRAHIAGAVFLGATA